MLYNPFSSGMRPLFDNKGATLSNLAMGTSTPAPSTANVKGSTVQLIAGATITKDCFGITIIFHGGSASANVSSFLVDIMVDPAGGTNWSVLIPNLLVASPDWQKGGFKYHFPLKITAGSAVGARVQGSAALAALRTTVILYGDPERPELVKYGTYVEAFGVNTSTSFGTAITPTSSGFSAYVSLGTTAKDLWWWQWGGISANDTSLTVIGYWGDVAAGDATNKKTCLEMGFQTQTSTEQISKEAFGIMPPICKIPGGATVYSRVGSNAAPDTSCSTAAYAMG